MATLRIARVGVVAVGLILIASVLLSTMTGQPGAPTPSGTINVVGDDPICYEPIKIDAGTVQPPDPNAARQYIFARFSAVPTLPVRREFERRHGFQIKFLDSLGGQAFTMRIDTLYWADGLRALKDEANLRASCLAAKNRTNRSSSLLLGDRTRLRGYDDPSDGTTIFITVYVRFHSDISLSEQKQILTDVDVVDVDSLETFNDEWRVTLPDDNLESLMDEPRVQWVEELEPAPVDDIDEARAAVGLPVDFGNEGDGTVVAQWEVCHPANKPPDEHPDLANRNDSGFGNKVCNKNPSNQFVLPSNRHATQVAGILIGDGSKSIEQSGSVNQWRGMAPKATVVSYSVHDVDGHSLFKEYVDAAQSMAVISSNSWGSTFDDYYHRRHSSEYPFRSALFDAISSLRDSAGGAAGPGQRLLIVTSSGNRGGDRIDPSTPNSPRYYWRTARIRNTSKNVLTVGNVASGLNNSVGWPAFDTGRGPTLDGRLKPDLVAPGSQEVPPLTIEPGIMSPVLPNNSSPDYYERAWGTSFSTPVVAGSAAMLTTTIREGTCSRNPTPAELRALLVHTAEDLTDASNEAKYPSLLSNYSSDEFDIASDEAFYFNVAPPTFSPNAPYVLDNPPAGVDALIGPDFVFGYGMVKPAIADSFAADGHFLRASVEQGYIEFPIYVREADLENGMLRVTLAWDDPPFARNANPDPETGYLQNDLDLVIVGPDGRRYYPWELDPSAPATAATQTSRSRFAFWPKDTGDHRNTIEQVAFVPPENSPEGTWRIQVWATMMSLPPQEFALASSIIQPDSPCADIPSNLVPRPATPPRERTFWVLFVIAVVILLLLLLWLAEVVYNAYIHKGHRAAVLRVVAVYLVLILIAVVLFNGSDRLMMAA